MTFKSVFSWHLLVYATFYAITVGVIASTFLLVPLAYSPNAFWSVVIQGLFVLATLQVGRYLFYMALSPWYSIIMSFKDTTGALYRPRVSVIVPAWNEEVGIISTVTSLLNNTYDNLEVVVINDGSTDGSDALLRDFAERYQAQTGNSQKRLVYHYKDNGGKGSALNHGLKLATGSIIMTVDADCLVDREAVMHAVEYFKDPTVMAGVANVKIAGSAGNFLSASQQIEFLLSFYFKKVDAMLNAVYIIGGAGGIFRRELFDAIGPFNESNITEDIELSMRIQRRGMKIVYAENAVIYTEGASDMQGLLKQRLRWKRGRIETFLQHRSLFFSLHPRHRRALSWVILPVALLGDIQLFFEPFFLVALYLVGLASHNFAPFLATICMLTFMLLMVFIFERGRDWRLLLLAPIAWLFFYVTTVVELNALVKSLWGILRKKELKWQRWQRSGITSS